MIEIARKADLTRLCRVENMSGVTFTGENGGHKFIITATRGDTKVTLTGSVTGRFIRPDGTSVQLTQSYAGIDTGGNAWVILPANCYTMAGPFGLVITYIESGTRTVIYSCTGYVRPGETSTVVDPENIINVDAILGIIDDCEKATTAATIASATAISAASAAVTNFAAPYATATAYKAGDYITNGGNFYLVTADITAVENTEFSDVVKTQVTAGVELNKVQESVSGLQGELYKEVSNPANWTTGNWGTSNGGPGTNPARIRTNSNSITGLDYIVKADTGVEFIVLFWTGNSYTAQTEYPWRTECNIPKIAPSGVTEFRLTVRTNPETTLTNLVEQTAAKIHFNVVDKVNKDQGVANAGKSLVVGNDGLVVPGETATETAANESLKEKLYTRVTGNGVLKTDGTIASVSGYAGRVQKAKLPVGVTKIYVSDYANWDTDKGYCILWFVKNGEMMENGYIQVTTKPQTWTDYEVTIPEGAEEVWYDRNATICTSTDLNDRAVGRITALENSYNLFVGPYTWTQRVTGLRMLADAQGCYFIPFNALGQGVSRGNGYYGDNYYRDQIHPTQLGAYNLALGVWSYLRHIPCWAKEMPGTVTTPTLDGTQWSGKSWYAYGTSLTSGTVSNNKYAEYVETMSGMTLTNKGYSGGALVTNRNIYNRLLDMTDGKLTADLITIEVSANDSTAEMGYPWSLDTNTFLGALNHCIHEMFAAGVEAQVVIMASTPGRYSASDSTDIFDVNNLYHT